MMHLSHSVFFVTWSELTEKFKAWVCGLLWWFEMDLIGVLFDTNCIVCTVEWMKVQSMGHETNRFLICVGRVGCDILVRFEIVSIINAIVQCYCFFLVYTHQFLIHSVSFLPLSCVFCWKTKLSHVFRGVLGSGGVAERILDLWNRWRLVVSFMLCLLYPPGMGLWYPSYRRLGGPQSQSVLCLFCRSFIMLKVKGHLAGSLALQLFSWLYPTPDVVVPSFISRGAIAPSGTRALC
jgi:hypothetical protein